MDKLTFAVVGQYHHNQEKASPVMKELVAVLRGLAEVNVFDMPDSAMADMVEKDDFLFVHHYSCPNGERTNAHERVWEIIRDIVALGPKECYIDFDVDDVYQPYAEEIEAAMNKYGITCYSLNRHTKFRTIRNLRWTINFRKYAHERKKDEEYELSQTGCHSTHGSMDGFRFYNSYEKQHAKRKQLLELIKQQ